MQHALARVDMEIKMISIAFSLTPDDDKNVPLLLTFLASAHEKRFELRNEPIDIHKVVECKTRLLTLTPDDDPSLPDLLRTLGAAHGKRFQRLGHTDDIDKATENLSLALVLKPEGHSDLPNCLCDLAAAHRLRFQHLGDPGDIEKAIEHNSQLIALTPSDDPKLPEYLDKLGETYLCRFGRFGEVNDLEATIEHQGRALALARSGHPYLSELLAGLAISYGHRFRRLGELGDIEKAIEYQSRALALISDDHPYLSSRFANLAVCHTYRFERLGEMGDLEKVIEYQSRALALTPDDHPELPSHLSNLVLAHTNRFKRLGKLGDVEQAIEYGTRGLVSTPDDHPQLSGYLANLAVSHKYRFERLGELGDLEQAIEYQSRVLVLTPNDHPDLPSCLSNLAISLGDRFKRLGDPSDIQKAVNYESRALALTPDNHPALSSRLANLAVCHKARFRRLGELGDLEQAIKYDSRALILTPEDHPQFLNRLTGLAMSQKNRFHCLGELADLEQAIENESRALTLIPDDHPDCCRFQFNHAISYIQYYQYSNNVSHSQESLNFFRKACLSLTGAPRDKFDNAYRWAGYASEHNALKPIEAYQVTIDLLPQFTWLGATTEQRYKDLKTIQSLAVDSAHSAILSSEHSLALEWLEHTRCIVWNQSTALRSPLDQLQATHPSLATNLRTVADRLHKTSSDSRESQALSRSMTLENVGQEHRRLAVEYENLISEARALPGFEDFLRPLRAHRLFHAARNGPIAVINCHLERCDALLILPQQSHVSHVPLPNFNGRKARRTTSELQMSVENTRQRERGGKRRPLASESEGSGFESVLAMLWYDVVKPILDFLGYTDNIPVDNKPHITWCPTSAMTFLPLHAAGDYDQTQSRVFDYVTSSYTPTLTALLESTPFALSPDSRLLAIGQADTPGHAPLPGTAEELEHVKARTQGKAVYTQLMDVEATTTIVLDAMEQHDWVHLACHAHQNVGNSTESGFLLHDGVLDLASINRRSFKGKGLAFLSACQTATGDETLPDEAVHLASGMLTAGYTSVIATMWSVHDKDAPLVADEVYSQLMKDGKLGNGEAGKALHNAVSKLRQEVGEEAFERWIPYIHIGS